jgi:hypothetical protein
MLSVTRISFSIMLNVIMVSVFMLKVVMLSVVVLIVVASFATTHVRPGL